MESSEGTVIVIGSGVIGLTTAITLQRAGYLVRIWARTFSPQTTSDIAAALWDPYLVGPPEKVAAWGAVAYERFREERLHPGRGVIWSRAVLCVAEQSLADDDLPAWRQIVDGFRRARPDEIPPGYADGYCFDSPVIDMSLYLMYLTAVFQVEGGRMELRRVTDVAEALDAAEIVVNCTGLGARELVGDRDLYPVRGQVVRVAPRPQATRAFLADGGPHGLVYIVPRVRDIVLGGVNAAHDESLAIDDAQTASILARVQAAAPWFGPISESDILNVACGLRPARSSGVRLERDPAIPGGRLFHNYGHGGGGVTLSWGCAVALAALVQER